MQKLTDWLTSLPQVSDVREVVATIEGIEYEGASYRDSNFSDERRLYLLGDLPKSYVRSSKTAFVVDGEDWYVACYMREPIPREFAEYHPFGKHFMLCRWSVPSGEPIDHYHYWRGEKRSYRRLPVEVSGSPNVTNSISPSS